MLLHKNKQFYLGKEVKIKQEFKEFGLVIVQVVNSNCTITIDAAVLKTTSMCEPFISINLFKEIKL